MSKRIKESSFAVAFTCALTIVCLAGCGKQAMIEQTGNNQLVDGSRLSSRDVSLEKESKTSNNSNDAIFTMTFGKKVYSIKKDNGFFEILDPANEVIYRFKGENQEVFCEEMHDCIGLRGYKLYESIPSPYGATVYYIVELNGKGAVVLENHATYKNGKFTDSFNSLVDINKDGKKELISRVSYIGDGGLRTFIYKNDKKSIVRGDLADLLGIPESKLDPKAVLLKSEYNKKTNKAVIEYKKKGKKLSKTQKKINMKKIRFEKISYTNFEEYFRN